MDCRDFTLLLFLLTLISCSKESGQQNNTIQLLDSLLLSESTENNFNGTIVVGNKDEIILIPDQEYVPLINRSFPHSYLRQRKKKSYH